jgi:hypothetical protein
VHYVVMIGWLSKGCNRMARPPTVKATHGYFRTRADSAHAADTPPPPRKDAVLRGADKDSRFKPLTI